MDDIKLLHRVRYAILIAFLAIVVGLFLAISYVQNAHESGTINKLNSILNNTFEKYQVWQKDTIQDLRYWNNSARFIEAIKALVIADQAPNVLINHPAQGDLRRLLQPWMSDFGLMGYFIINRDGISLASSRDYNIGTYNIIKERLPERFDRVFSEGYSFITMPMRTDLSQSSNSNDVTMFAVTPIFDNDGTIIAAFTSRLDPKTDFSNIFQSGRMGLSSETYAVNKKGKIISESRFNGQLRQIGLLTNSQDSLLNIEVREPGYNMLKNRQAPPNLQNRPFTFMAKQALSGQNGMNIDGYNDYRGVTVLGAWRWDPENEIAVTTEVDLDEEYADRDSAIFTILLFGFLVLLTLTLIYYAVYWLQNYIRQKNAQILSTQKRLQLILDSTAEGIIGVDTKGYIIFTNHAALKLLGYEEREILGANIHDMTYNPNDSFSEKDMLENSQIYRSYTKGEIYNISNDRILNKDGNPLTIRFASRPIIIKSNIIGAVINFTDIHEEIDNQRRLERAKIDAESANRAKNLFLTSMSHELRTPLTAILGFTQILLGRDKSLDRKNSTYIREIQNSGQNLLKLIDDILELTQIENRDLSVNLDQFNLSTIIQDVAKTVKPLADEKGVELIVSMEKNEASMVYSDPVKLGQVLLNIATNGIKYNREGGSLTLSVMAQSTDYIRIFVIDTGFGLTTEQQTKLWEPFNRLGAESSTIEGTGIGLSIARALIERMGGYIGVKSILGKGSSFWIDVPVSAPVLKKALEVEEASTGPQTKRKALPNFAEFKDMKIHCIEDNLSNQRVLQTVFNHQTGILFSVSNNAESGFDHICRDCPDVLLLDINLPMASGVDLLQWVRANENIADLPVIITSANQDTETLALLKRLKVSAIIPKPIDFHQLFQAIQQATSKP